MLVWLINKVSILHRNDTSVFNTMPFVVIWLSILLGTFILHWWYRQRLNNCLVSERTWVQIPCCEADMSFEGKEPMPSNFSMITILWNKVLLLAKTSRINFNIQYTTQLPLNGIKSRRKTSCMACRQKSTKKNRKEHWMLHSENVLIYFSCEDNVVTQQRFFSFEFRAFSNNDKMYLSASSS